MEKKFKEGICQITLIGPESTGKTTLSKELADRFSTLYVPEYLRIYAQKKWDKYKMVCEWDDLLPIFHGQLNQEKDYMAKLKNRIIFFDTNIISLLVYSYLYFNDCPVQIIQEANKKVNDYYFLTDIDVPWQWDILRDRPNDRKKIFNLFKEELINRKLSFSILSGSLSHRIKQAEYIIERLIN